jgi:hypothetical protein
MQYFSYLRGSILIALLALSLQACKLNEGEPTEFVEYGWIEPVAITSQGIVLYAKLDTGADNCSINAYDIEVYKKDKKQWVKFKITTRQGEEHIFDLPILRFARIKRIGGEHQVRPVVRLYVCLGGQYMSVDVNLVNRENFAYPMLIGRSFLQGHAMVNPAKSFTSNPQCVIPEE